MGDEQPGDTWIVHAARNNWHEAKQRFPSQQLTESINWKMPSLDLQEERVFSFLFLQILSWFLCARNAEFLQPSKSRLIC
ncbi:hypothetical protein ACFQAT_01100 [Undibacterium arcticum]|uniref:Uncharacterized protein n=1 Tax=Undibacterium arcticum TaxID=1762892 RepID=A0ABV7F1C0_9BURK